MAVVDDGARLRTTLGSCVGVILYDENRKRSALAHIMLPARFKGDNVAAKYADTAIPALLEEMERRGSQKQHLSAYLAGGAHMFGGSGDIVLSAIGQQNLEAARETLARLQIDIVYEETGGTRGRIVLFDGASAKIDVTTVQPPARTRKGV